MQTEGNRQRKEGKRILTALNQAARKRFTFEYGCCSSKGERVIKKRKRNQEREERKGTVTVHHGE